MSADSLSFVTAERRKALDISMIPAYPSLLTAVIVYESNIISPVEPLKEDTESNVSCCPIIMAGDCCMPDTAASDVVESFWVDIFKAARAEELSDKITAFAAVNRSVPASADELSENVIEIEYSAPPILL